MNVAPKTVNAEMMKALIRALIKVNEVYSVLDDVELIGFGHSEKDQAYELQYNAVYYSLDERILEQLEEEGGIAKEDVAMYDLLIAKIADTPFQEAKREEE